MLDQKEALKLATVKTIFSDVANVGRIAGPETTQFRDVQKFISSAIMFHQVLVAVKEIDKWKQSETLANRSGNLGVENSKGQTLLHICTSRCYHEAMSQLLDLGEINVDHQGKSGNTALHGVVNKSGPYSISMAIDLLKASANPTIKNGERESPLDISEKPEQDNKQINPMLMEELPVVREGGGGVGLAEKDGRQSLGKGIASVHEDAINACRETIIVLRNIAFAEKSGSQPETHIPLYGHVYDIIYRSEKIGDKFQKMSHHPPRGDPRDTEGSCRWIHIPMNNVFRPICRSPTCSKY